MSSSLAEDGDAAGPGRANSRAALMAAALAEFTEKGYEAATVAEIAERAGVTTGALYAHFRGKLDLLLESLGLRTVGDPVNNAVAPGAKLPWTEIAAALDRDMTAAPPRETLLLLDVIVLARRNLRLAATMRRLLGIKLDELTDAAEAGRAAGMVHSDLSSADLARVLVLIAFGTMVLAAIEERLPTSAAFIRISDALLTSSDPTTLPPGSALEVVAGRARGSKRARADFEAAVSAAVAQGHSLREVGKAADVSHEQIRRIVADDRRRDQAPIKRRPPVQRAG